MKLFYKAAQIRLEQKKKNKSGTKNILCGSKRNIYSFCPCPALQLHLSVNTTYKMLPLAVNKENSKRYELQSPFHHLLALGERAHSTEKPGDGICNTCCSLRNSVIILEGYMFANGNHWPHKKYQP